MTPRGAWSDFWANAGSEACLPNAPAPVREALAAVWTGLATALSPAASVLDIAAGNGAVLHTLRAARPDLILAGIDYADVGPAARRLGIVGGVDAAALPFGDAAFDAVTSQFGIEYCAAGALAEAGRVLRPGGHLRLVIHDTASQAITHNRGRHAAIAALVDAGLFVLARAVAAGRPEDARLAMAIADARQRHAAQGVSEELPMAIGQLLQRRAGLAGIAAIETRVRAEVARLEAMIAAARDGEGIGAMSEALRGAGCAVTSEALRTGTGEIVAWQVSGRRLQ